MNCTTALGLILITALAGSAARAQQAAPFGSVASHSFARLLRIDPQPPPVSARSTGVRTEDGVVIEDIAWDSPAGGTVPVFLMKPANLSGKAAAIVCLHGSSGSRESMSTREFGVGDWTTPGRDQPHQRLLGWCRELAREGYVTLALTQRGLDRRMPDSHDQSKDFLVHGRTMMGVLVDEIRQGVSYLAARPEVDPARIGMTGLSFGGITTLYTWFVDGRVAAAAPICGGVGSVEAMLRKGRPSYHGFYWWIPDMLLYGDQGDFAAAMAPRPLMVWAPTEDIGMPKEGVDRFAAIVKPAYEAAGKPQNLEIHQDPGQHEFSPAAFEALKAFLKKHLR